MRAIYLLFLNGKYYGCGSKDHINSLITDYIVNCDMYGKEEVYFKVLKSEKKHG
ncbi:TPA: hypothetical protein ACGXND_005230 [Bacillus tropicus]